MEQLFLSDKNINKITLYLSKHINTNDNKKANMYLQKFIILRMKIVFNEYGSKRKEMGVSKTIFIDMMIKKTIIDCIRLFKNRIKKFKKKYNIKNFQNLNFKRDQEVFGRREIKVQSRPVSTSIKRQELEKNNEVMSNDSNSTYAEVNNSNGVFFDASGRMSNQPFFRKTDVVYEKGVDNKKDLEKK